MAKTKVTMPDDLKSKCAAVIHTATTAAAAAKKAKKRFF